MNKELQNEELQKVGQLLKSKRDEMHLSLKEVENATSIRQLYLQAIEEGRISQYLSPAYAMGFFKQYASFLGLDGEKILKEYSAHFRNQIDKQEFIYGIGTLEVRGGPQGGVRKIPSYAWIAIGGGVLVAAWYFGKAVGAF
jgi:cytoskeletal protein RodZ